MKSAGKVFLILVGIFVMVLFKKFTKDEIKQNELERYDSQKPTNQIEWNDHGKYGLQFKTPTKLKYQKHDVPYEIKDYVKKVEVYIGKYQTIAMNHSIMQTNLDEYDAKGGLEGAIQNFINSQTYASNLVLDFYDKDEDESDIESEGSYQYKQLNFNIYGYAWMNKNKVVHIVMIAYSESEKDKEIIDKIKMSLKKTSHNNA